jgi:general secretion pathway protein N
MKRVLIVVALVATALVTVLINAPAAWIGDWIEARSKLRLVDARGTVWRGSALLGMSDGRATTLVPGRVDWRLELLPEPAVQVSHPWLTAPLRLMVSGKALAFGAGSARLPAGVLASAGMPFNTLRPGGTLEARWSQGELSAGALTGELQIDWRDATSALSPVAPLGTYRILVTGRGDTATLDLQTLRGPLQMEGSGRINGLQVRFRGTATAEPSSRAALDGLLGLLGMRSGDKVLLAFDT